MIFYNFENQQTVNQQTKDVLSNKASEIEFEIRESESFTSMKHNILKHIALNGLSNNVRQIEIKSIEISENLKEHFDNIKITVVFN